GPRSGVMVQLGIFILASMYPFARVSQEVETGGNLGEQALVLDLRGNMARIDSGSQQIGTKFNISSTIYSESDQGSRTGRSQWMLVVKF
ncbi:hypothetical protein BYT27DRAFT_7186229, partial [Phlegmacium glaucopus]